MTCVFLSHSSADKAAVSRLADDLAAAGIDVWLDERQLGVGDPITQRIQEGIAASDYVAVWLTKQAVASEWVQREWGTKLRREITDRDVQVLPLLAESCEIPLLLEDKKYADFRYDYDCGLDKLLAALGTRRNWTQETLEGYLVEHHDPSEFEQSKSWGKDYALIVRSASMDGWRGVFWDKVANRLGVWETIGATWYGPDKLTDQDIKRVLQRLRGGGG